MPGPRHPLRVTSAGEPALLGFDAPYALGSTNYRIELRSSPEHETLHLHGPSGRVFLTVLLDGDEPKLIVETLSVAVRSGRHLSLEAESLAVRVKHDLSIEVGGRLESSAFEQVMRATTGDVRINANDDVRVNGERIHLNSPYPEQRAAGPQAEDVELGTRQ